VALRLRQGDPTAIDQALKTISDETANPVQRIGFLQVLSEIKVPAALPALLGIAETTANAAVRKAALTALEPYDDLQIGARVVALYARIDKESLATAQRLLASQHDFAQRIVAELGIEHFFNIQLVGDYVIEVNPRISTIVYQEDFELPYLGVKRALGEISDDELRELAARIRPGRTALRYFDQLEFDQ